MAKKQKQYDWYGFPNQSAYLAGLIMIPPLALLDRLWLSAWPYERRFVVGALLFMILSYGLSMLLVRLADKLPADSFWRRVIK